MYQKSQPKSIQPLWVSGLTEPIKLSIIEKDFGAFFANGRIMKYLSLFLIFTAYTCCAAPLALQELTEDEIIGQTLTVRIDAGDQARYQQAIKDGLIGTVLIKGGLEGTEPPAQKRALTIKTIQDLRRWEKQSRHQIPLLIAFDYESGSVISPLFLGMKRLPSNMLLGAGNSKKATRQAFAAAAQEIRSFDGQINFGPDLDVNTNPQNPIIGTRSFGAQTKIVQQLARQAVKGLQKNKVAAFAKHFPGHGDTQEDTHLSSAVMDLPLEELTRQHIAPFRAAIDAGIWGIMSSHVIYPALDKEHPASFSHKILTDLLRKKLGFKGVIATDSLDMEGAKREHGIAQAVAEAYAAGADMPLIGKELPYDIIAYVKQQYGKTLSSNRLRQSAARVLELKKKTGLFDKKVKIAKVDFDQAEQTAAQKGVTWVKGDMAPLPKGPVCFVLFHEPSLQYMLPALKVPFRRAGHKTRSVYLPMTPSKQDLAAARACARRSKTLIVGSYQKYGQPDENQQYILQELLAQYPQAIFLSLLSPYDLAFYPQVKTALALYGPTPQTLHTAAQILLGEEKPSGQLKNVL